ncbi:TlpA family protein disulfide reductase [Pedobacter polaris]|uniref:TlpA family protein disulfide reductase n=1 Tax=Pedobacter polaris TaxID=2571273 RepID=UPI00145DE253|nr:TlpA disulfide reductase family protein [Pedobacter polaris]
MKAQIPQVLNNSYANLKALKSLSYCTNFTEENPFNPGDFFRGTTKSQISYNDNSSVNFKKEERNINLGQIFTREIYNNSKLHTFDLVDSTYTKDDIKGGVKSELHEIISGTLILLRKNPSKILQYNDTLFNGKKCYQFLIKAYDTLANGNHDYTFKTVLIEKHSLMPVYYKEIGAGTAFKDGFPIGRLKFFIEKSFIDIKVNELIVDTEIKTDGFHELNTSMLNVGEIAPPIDVIPIANDELNDISVLKAPVKLVVFGSTTCSANPLSNPMLNRLHSKYSTKPFSIVNIYTGDKVEQITKYVQNNSLKFPVFFGTRLLRAKFKTVGTPNFYLIDPNGRIVASISGYSNSLEEELTTKIDTLLKKIY